MALLDLPESLDAFLEKHRPSDLDENPVVVEELWWMGGRTQLEELEEVLKSLSSAGEIFPTGSRKSAVWWKGQALGRSWTNRPDDERPQGLEKALQALLHPSRKNNQAFLFSVRRDGSVRVLDFNEQTCEWLKVPTEMSGVDVQSTQVARDHLVRTGRLDGLLDRRCAPFEELAMLDDLKPFHDALTQTTWGPAEVAAWRRCAEAWLHRDVCVFDPPNRRFGRDWQGDGNHQAEVLWALARAVPAEVREAEKEGAWERFPSSLQTSRPQDMRDIHLATCCWWRGLFGEDQAWIDFKSRVSFVNGLAPRLVDWFGNLSHGLQCQALDRAVEEIDYLRRKDVSANRCGVSHGLPGLYEHCPHWEGWDEQLEWSIQSRDAPAAVIELHGRRRAEKLSSRLEHRLEEPSEPEIRKSKVRM